MAQPKKTPKKTPAASVDGRRKLRRPKITLRPRLRRQIKQSRPPLPSAWRIFKNSLGHLRKNWWLFLGITLVYFILTIIFVKGFGSTNNLADLRGSFDKIFTGTTGRLAGSFALFGVLLSSAGTTTDAAASVYQSVLMVVVSLALIWALRQTYAKIKVTIRGSFYDGMYPLVPFVLILLCVGLQLIPLIVAGSVYGLVFNTGLAAHWYEQFAWAVVLLGLMLWSFYMISSSLFALYIVTLPNVRPMQALRSARELVRFRRWTVMRKLLFLPVILLVLGAAILVPLILLLPGVVGWVFIFLTMLTLAVVHSYMYSLYRGLL